MKGKSRRVHAVLGPAPKPPLTPPRVRAAPPGAPPVILQLCPRAPHPHRLLSLHHAQHPQGPDPARGELGGHSGFSCPRCVPGGGSGGHGRCQLPIPAAMAGPGPAAEFLAVWPRGTRSAPAAPSGQAEEENKRCLHLDVCVGGSPCPPAPAGDMEGSCHPSPMEAVIQSQDLGGKQRESARQVERGCPQRGPRHRCEVRPQFLPWSRGEPGTAPGGSASRHAFLSQLLFRYI